MARIQGTVDITDATIEGLSTGGEATDGIVSYPSIDDLLAIPETELQEGDVAAVNNALFTYRGSDGWKTSDAILFSSFGGEGDGLADNAPIVAKVESFTDGCIIIHDGIFRFDSSVTLNNKIVFLGNGRIKPSAGVNVHLAAGYLAQDMAHVFDISEGGRVTGDEVDRGYVTPQHWGGKPERENDIYESMTAAIRYASINKSDKNGNYAEGLPVKLPSTGGWYRTSQTIFVTRTIHIFGETLRYGRTQGGIVIRGDGGLDAVMAIVSSDTPWDENGHSGANSIIENITIAPIPFQEPIRQGFVHNVPCYFINCYAMQFSEAGFHAHGQTSGPIENLFDHPGRSNKNRNDPDGEHVIEYNGTGSVAGNVNGSVYDRCGAPNNGLHGFVAHGNNAGFVKYHDCDATNNMGAGFIDNTSIGVEWHGCHTSRNTFRVNHNGEIYMCVKAHIAAEENEPGVGSDWRRFWAKPSSSSQYDEEWTSGREYFRPSGGYHVTTGSALSTILGCYTEGGIEIGVCARGQTTVVGGWASRRVFWHSEADGVQILGPGSPKDRVRKRFMWRTDVEDESTEYGAALGSFSPTGGILMEVGDGRDDPDNRARAMTFAWNPIRGRYEWRDSSNQNKAIYGVSGVGFTGEGFEMEEQSYFWANGMYLADGTATGETAVRIRAVNSIDDIRGDVIESDIFFYKSLKPGGKVGAVCTQSGTVGVDAVIKEFGLIDS